MITGFEIAGLVGVLTATIDLVERLRTLMQNHKHAQKDFESLMIQLGVENARLVRYKSAFEQMFTAELKDDERILVHKMVTEIGEINESLNLRIQNLNTVNSTTFKIMWSFHMKSQFEHLEAKLARGTTNLATLFASIKMDLEATSRVEPKADSSEVRMENLMSLYGTISKSVPGPDRRININRLEPKLQSTKRCVARLSPAHSARLDAEPEPVLVEHMATTYMDEYEARRSRDATAAIDSVLINSDPDHTRILASLGYFQNKALGSCGLLYRLPHDIVWSLDPKPHDGSIDSLADLLKRSPQFSRNDRLRCAYDLARAVLYIHFVEFVHKGIQPNNIIFFQSSSTPSEKRFPNALPRPYLVGFDRARTNVSAVESQRVSDGCFEYDIYRHPERQGVRTSQTYSMAHDIYSLGVVLLELGLWGLPGFIPFQDSLDESYYCKRPYLIKAKLQDLAMEGVRDGQGRRSRLSTIMGEEYVSLVKWCLDIKEEEAPSSSFMKRVWTILDNISWSGVGKNA